MYVTKVVYPGSLFWHVSNFKFIHLKWKSALYLMKSKDYLAQKTQMKALPRTKRIRTLKKEMYAFFWYLCFQLKSSSSSVSPLGNQKWELNKKKKSVIVCVVCSWKLIKFWEKTRFKIIEKCSFSICLVPTSGCYCWQCKMWN